MPPAHQYHFPLATFRCPTQQQSRRRGRSPTLILLAAGLKECDPFYLLRFQVRQEYGSGFCDRVSSGIFHSVRGPMFCDFVLLTCDGGHLVYKVLSRYLVSLRVCSGPQQTRYFASILALAETSTDST